MTATTAAKRYGTAFGNAAYADTHALRSQLNSLRDAWEVNPEVTVREYELLYMVDKVIIVLERMDQQSLRR
jgi:hypothetical protein